MRDTFIIYYMTKALREYLQRVSNQLPLAPMDSVLRNVLDFSNNGGNTTIIQDFCAEYLGLIKLLQKTPDEESGLHEVPFVPFMEQVDIEVNFDNDQPRPLSTTQQQIG
jgi:hypothetical protein